VYYNGAKPSDQDINNLTIPNFDPAFSLEEKGDEVYLNLNFEASYFKSKGKIINTELLGKAKIPNAAFNKPDGSPLTIDFDYFGKLRSVKKNDAGPFNNLKKGKNVVKVW
jgi:alpha-N-arabinofuranosidase